MLTPGAIQAIQQDQKPQPNALPVVQVLAVKKIQSNNKPNAQDRYRIVLSDGNYYQQAMLGIQQNHLIASNVLVQNCIVRLKEFLCNQIQGKRIVIILNLEVIQQSDAVIGNPQNIESVDATKISQTLPKQQVNNPPPQQQQPQQLTKPNQFKTMNQTNNMASTRTAQEPATFPISSLNPYQNKWTIKARVTKKGQMRYWQNDKSSGNLFSVDLVDNQGGEIRATCFKELADQLYEVLQEGHVYLISRGQIKFANSKFNNLSHDYEITFDANTTVEPCPEDAAIPTIQFNFEQIANLENKDKDSNVDVVAIISQVADVSQINTKAGKQLSKRDLMIADDSGASVKLTIWAERAEQFNSQIGTIVAIKGARLSDYGGVSLSLSGSSSFETNPDLPEAHRLRGWFDETGGAVYRTLTQEFTSGSSAPAPAKTFEEIKQVKLDVGKPFKFSNRATITSIPDKDGWYDACPGKDPNDASRNCNKKVVEMNGNWVCDKCEGTFAQPRRRYVLSVCVSDATGHSWVTLFDEAAHKLLGQSADVLNAWKEEGEDEAVVKLYKEKSFQTFNMKMIAKEEIYEGDPKLKYSVQSISSVNYVEQSRELVSQIQQLMS